MRAAASLILLVTLAACASSPTRTNERVEFWQRKLAQDLHVGMAKGEIQAWGDANHVKFSEQYSKGKLELAAFAEDVPDSRYSLLTGCTGWHIALYIFLDDSERMTGDRVRAFPICV